MAKDKVEPKEVELSEKQQYIQLQLTDLANKEKNLMFQLDQVKASQQVFKQAFIDASKEVAEEVLKKRHRDWNFSNICNCKYFCLFKLGDKYVEKN